jgi:autotransporter-associated beta strand protein
MGMLEGRPCWQGRCCSGGRRVYVAGAVSLALTIGLALLDSQAARAACSPPAASNITATCTGATVNQGAGAPGTSVGVGGYGTGSETGITVNVVAGSSIASTTYDGVYIGAGTVNNGSGASISGGPTGRGIEAVTGTISVNNSGSITGDAGISSIGDATVTNNAGASITGTAGFGILTSIGAVNLSNSGSIAGTGAGILAATHANVTNNAGASITGGLGIFAEAGGSSILNAGTISGSTTAIRFTGSGNTLTLAPGSAISGNVLGTGSDTFQLGGSGAATLDVSQIGAAAQYQGFGTFNKVGSSTWTLTGATGAVTSWAINQGTLAVTDDNNLGNASGGITFNGGTLQTSTPVGVPSFVSNRAITLQAGGGTIETLRLTFLSGDISGVGGLTKTGIFALALEGNNSYLGPTNVNAGSLAALSSGAFSASSAFNVASGASLELHGFNESIGSLAGGGDVDNNGAVAATTLTTGFDNTTKAFSGTISDGGGASLALTKVGLGTQVLSGINTYTGATTVNGGTLEVDGSIASSPLTTVNANAALTGTGAVGATQINAGGIFAPGNGTPGSSMTLASLALQSGALYLVQIDPATSSFANVTGTATLGGATVNAVYVTGSYVEKKYTILTASNVSDAFASTAVNTNLPSGFKTSLSYDATHAYLDLSLAFVPPPGTGLNGNQQNVGNAIINFFNSNGSIPIVFGALTPAGLTQISGETATGSQQTTFQAMGQFLGVMTDPFIAGRGDPIGAGGSPTGFADDEALAYAPKRRPSDALAAIYSKAPPRLPTFEQRWSVWAAGFGGSQTTDGNALVGSNDTRSSIYGAAVGADYRFSPDTLAGFALAGGGTNFSVANNLGGGRSDLFQAGAFIRHNIGAAYLSGAFAYGWQDITTDRTVTVAGIDRLRAEFNANAWSGRIEGGYRFVAPWMGGIGITPYAAGQFTAFELPNYAEHAIVGTDMFALAYNSKSVTDTRSELGLRTDKSFAMQDGILTLRGRAAWAHDFNPDRAIAATFQTLPGASFVVNGAAQASDSALTTASAEMKWPGGWSAAATFEGEFSDVTRSYAGKGVMRYAW